MGRDKRFSYQHPLYTDPLDPYAKGSQDPFAATPTADPYESKSASTQETLEKLEALVTQFPSHLYVPDGAQSLDMRRLVSLAAFSVDEEVFKFQAPRGQKVWFMAYSIFSDGELAGTQEFIPRVDGARVFPYHGDPNNNFKINLGLGPDMSNQNLIHCQLPLEPGQILTWNFTNNNAVPIAMGVRMVGYLDSQGLRAAKRVGG